MISEKFAHVLKTICVKLGEADILWAVTGSLGFALQGMNIPVHDIDLQTDKDGAYQIEKSFPDQIVRPVTLSSSENIQSHYGELHIDGVKVEIMGDLQKRLPDGSWEEPVDIRAVKKYAYYRDLTVPVLSLKYEYEAYKKLGRFEKAELIRKHLRKPVALEVKQVVELFPKAPFHFDATMHKPSHFPSADNAWEPGIRWQTMLWRATPIGLTFENQGTVEHPRLKLSIWSTEEFDIQFLHGLLDELIYRYNLQLDLAEFTQKFRDDPQLGPIISKWRGMRPMTCHSLYEYLIIAIVLQNANVRRSVNMMQALFEQYGTLLRYDGKDLYCFWEPEDIDRVIEQELRDLKVGYRAKSIKRVTEAFARKDIDEFVLRDISKTEQREALLNLYGIGPASVWYILFDVFHHMDELNHISPWEQKIYSKLFFDTDPEEPVPVDNLLKLFVKRFGKYKMLAVHYIWEDLFWRRQHENIPWLEKLIRL
jgi:3-methyladenine DNA glycosylase/8-oxoguanine DNA glycosylase